MQLNLSSLSIVGVMAIVVTANPLVEVRTNACVPSRLRLTIVTTGAY